MKNSTINVEEIAGGVTGVFAAMTVATHAFDQPTLELFLDVVPERGVELWDRFRGYQWKAGNEQKDFLDFIRETVVTEVVENPQGFAMLLRLLGAGDDSSNGYNDFQHLMRGQWNERRKAADRLLAELLSEEEKASLEEAGISFRTRHMPSRKNPKLFIFLDKGDSHLLITCKVGERILEVNYKKVATLKSVRQLHDKILEESKSLA